MVLGVYRKLLGLMKKKQMSCWPKAPVIKPNGPRCFLSLGSFEMLFDLGFLMPRSLSEATDFETVPQRKGHLTVHLLM